MRRRLSSRPPAHDATAVPPGFVGNLVSAVAFDGLQAGSSSAGCRKPGYLWMVAWFIPYQPCAWLEQALSC